MLGDNKMWAVRQRQQGVILQGEKRKDGVEDDKKITLLKRELIGL
jgi:hypothetical protein